MSGTPGQRSGLRQAQTRPAGERSAGARSAGAQAGPGGDQAAAGGERPLRSRRVPVWRPEWEPSRAGAAAGGRRTAWKAVFFVLASAAIVAGVAWALLGSRFLVVRSIRVTGTGPLVPRARVLAAAGIGMGLPLIRVNAAAVAHRVEGIRQVRSAEVSRDWPDTVVISVRLRKPVFALPGPGGYALIDRFGVDVRRSRGPGRLPVLMLPPGAPGPRALRGSAAVHAAAVVLGELPARLRGQVRSVSADGPSDVSVRLADGVDIVWGGTGRAAQKKRELAVLMRTHARLYDVSAPGTVVTQG